MWSTVYAAETRIFRKIVVIPTQYELSAGGFRIEFLSNIEMDSLLSVPTLCVHIQMVLVLHNPHACHTYSIERIHVRLKVTETCVSD